MGIILDDIETSILKLQDDLLHHEMIDVCSTLLKDYNSLISLYKVIRNGYIDVETGLPDSVFKALYLRVVRGILGNIEKASLRLLLDNDLNIGEDDEDS